MLTTLGAAYSLLERLGAPRQLLVHLQLVVEAADELISALERLADKLWKGSASWSSNVW